MNNTWGFVEQDFPPRATSTEPTRVCAVCRANELGYTGSYYSRTEFWLCPECLKRLKKLLDKSTEL